MIKITKNINNFSIILKIICLKVFLFIETIDNNHDTFMFLQNLKLYYNANFSDILIDNFSIIFLLILTYFKNSFHN